MIAIRRTIRQEKPVEWAGSSATFASEAWTFALGTSHFGLGWSYRRPQRVAVEGSRIDMFSMPLHDYVMLARLAAFLLIALALLSRRRQP